MKAASMINRIGQFVILAIGFMACVGWNQATVIQNDNLSSIAQKRVKDMVKVRYILPHSNLHTVPTLCKLDAQDLDGNYLDPQDVSLNVKNSIKQDSDTCRSISTSLLRYVQTNQMHDSSRQKASDLIMAAFSCSKSSQFTGDTFPRQMYFSRFANIQAMVDDSIKTTNRSLSEVCLVK